MKTKNLFVLSFAILGFVLSLLFLWNYFNSSVEKTCGIENCHGLDITCGTNVPEACDMMYMGGDGCRQFAKCESTNGNCKFVESQEFTNCKDCVKRCEEEFTNDPAEFFNCESQCI